MDNKIYENTEKINIEIAKMKELNSINTKQISDTHHTYEILYKQRLILFSILCNKFSEISWKSKKHFDEENDPMFNGDFIAGINTPKGPATFHIKLKYWDLFNVIELDRAFPYDGSSVGDVMDRLLSLNEYGNDNKRFIKK